MKVVPMTPKLTGLATAISPVCGMTVTLKPDSGTESHGGSDFHFCSEKCQTKFNADPWFYAGGRAPANGHAVAVAAQYTCPMHPQILQDKPGNCPICGMALEPVVASDVASPDFTRRMWISAAAAVPLVIPTMGAMIGLPVRDWIGHGLARYLEFVPATPVVLWAAWPFFKRGWASLTNRSLNMWTLISIGVLAAYGYSVVATFLPGIFPDAYQMEMGVGTYYEAAVVIVALVFVGQVLELRARTHWRCDPGAVGLGTQNRAAHPAGRLGIRRAFGQHQGRWYFACAPRRCRACRRRDCPKFVLG